LTFVFRCGKIIPVDYINNRVKGGLNEKIYGSSFERKL